MRILVTGAASLVGSHLIDHLLDEGHEVIGIDDFSRGSWSVLSHLAHDPRFLFVEHDVASPFQADVDFVFHLALPSSSSRWAEDPVVAAMTCVNGTRNVLALGKPVVIATALDFDACALGCLERMLAGKDVRSVRFASPYGPRMLPDDPIGCMALGEGQSGEATRVTSTEDAVTTLLEARTAEPGTVSTAPSQDLDSVVLASIAEWFEGKRRGPERADRSSGIFLKKPERRTA